LFSIKRQDYGKILGEIQPFRGRQRKKNQERRLKN
jgi:hypothetical protein